MLQLRTDEMYNIDGGAAFSYMFLNAITKAVGAIYSIGQSIGSSIRRITSGNYC